jgi:hypothetical protein
MSHRVETSAGKFVVYMGSESDHSESHNSLEWYYAPEGWTGEAYSKGYYSPEAAEEACWENSGKRAGDG